MAVNTVKYNKHDYAMRLRSRLNKLVNWKDILEVIYTNSRTFVKGAMSTEPSVQTGTRESAYSYQNYVLGQDTGTISAYRVLPILIDEADRYQQTYVDQMKLADFQGRKIDEYVDAQTLAQYGSWTDFGATDLTNTGDDDTTQITVSATNVDDLIRAIKRKINANNGTEFMVENGAFCVWRPQDFEVLEAFVQANGFREADIALKNGIPVSMAFYYMGMYHYLSTQHTANHLFAGVRKMGSIGILRGTYGKVKFIEDPAKISGLGVVTRIDYGFEFSGTTSYYKELFMDVNVA